MRRFRVHINGRSYEVEVEELDRPVTDVAPRRPVNVTPTAATLTPSPVPQTAQVAPAEAAEITAPLPGLILEVRVSPGQDVAEDDVLVVLEAMKMENELTAPQAGTVKEVHVQVGNTVNQGDVLVVLG